MSDNNPSVLVFHVKPTTTNAVIRSAPIKQYFQGLTSNVDVLYPTQANIGLLLCKAKRTQEKILNMQHIMNGATIQLSQLPRQIYDQTRSTLSVHSIQQIGPLMQQYLPFLDASGGRIHNNQDGSVTLESNVYLLNAINSFMLNKLSQKSNQSHSTNEPIALKSGNEPIISKSLNEPIILKSGTVTTKVMCGKLLEQKVEGILYVVQ
ncbi:unnamed protein product [Didymodactylos carnosus]|uniref:Uncharacterized protein n=1 Tax=Didymodactylos carnosus TaxID=1234261 RepID=A0A8S2D8Q8_9BILA|nr:unnamed protein product [Didymodactylos carnosus]CAF3686743.1 unnamed protein product [Didymodactylos carnosus]